MVWGRHAFMIVVEIYHEAWDIRWVTLEVFLVPDAGESMPGPMVLHRICGELSDQEGGVFGDFGGQGFGEDAGLEFEGAAVADFVIEEGMGDERVHALFIDLEKSFASGGGEIDGLAGADEVLFGDDAVVDAVEHGGFGDKRTKFLHQVEREGGPSEARLVVIADVRIESHRQGGQSAVLAQEAVSQGKHGKIGLKSHCRGKDILAFLGDE